ncbi:small ribosomal subunit protein mS37 [Cottoperca gobio]|uniref:Small ribosomal subunit protein mS37 n=1 Tax=Cottoperca gobio TaxID=56716 RepID=A0A6J2R508_COTGO|nr:coiled-coil-helix-coiled-coil-helix domain-containing protein 1 [Cottoperca gobio]
MMASKGGILFQEKVSRMLSGHNGKPVLKPKKTLALKDEVANRKFKTGGATCVAEISVLMACWKQNNFVDSLCSNEMNSFYTCVGEAQAAKKNIPEQSSFQGERLPPKQVTTLLKRYPNIRKEI